MPATLNALIRYKTIDTCLRNRYVRNTIDRLREACSEALNEYRGRDKKVSERTIRDDLRVMRSDILGFNAPIVVDDGAYSYSDPEYSIFSVNLQDTALLREILRLLSEEKENIRDPKVDVLIKRILKVIDLAEPDYSKVNTVEESPQFRYKYMPVGKEAALSWGMVLELV